MAISADSGHSAASYRYRGSITPRARLLEKGALGVNKCAKQDALLFVEQNEQRAGQAWVPSRFMRKIVCRLRLNEVSRQ